MVVCRDCKEQSGSCQLCGIPVKGTKPSDSIILCANCRLSAKYCDICHTLISGKYFVSSDGKHTYCANCEAHAKRCSSCNALMHPGSWYKCGEYELCARCYQELPRCKSCGLPVVGTSVFFKGFEGFYCQKCADQKPKCRSCGRPCDSGAIILHDKIFICSDCADSAILTNASLKRLAEEVQADLLHTLNMKIDHKIHWELAENLTELADTQYRECGRFVYKGDHYTIQILKGLSREIAIETIAHELGHAWQTEHIPSLDGDLWREGFAQWIAAQAIKNYGFKGLLDRLESRQDLYGQGYWKLMELERKYSRNAMLHVLKNQ